MEIFTKQKKDKEFEERVVEINRVARTVAGGRRIRFRAAVVIGNRRGKVGIGVAKSSEVVNAVDKAIKKAKNKMINVALKDGTIPYETQIRYGGAIILLKPAAAGTGLIAGGVVRSVAELSGITDLLSKSLGSENKINCLKATMIALENLKMPKVKVIKEEKSEEKTEENKEKLEKEKKVTKTAKKSKAKNKSNKK
jgi:small subunit ribosomal protein S5